MGGGSLSKISNGGRKSKNGISFNQGIINNNQKNNNQEINDLKFELNINPFKPNNIKKQNKNNCHTISFNGHKESIIITITNRFITYNKS